MLTYLNNAKSTVIMRELYCIYITGIQSMNGVLPIRGGSTRVGVRTPPSCV